VLKLSTKSRYAARILVCLAARDDARPIQRREIARSEGISVDYVEQILMRLKSAGLVESHRGVKGGYTLARDPKRITVTDAILATDGPPSIVPDCKRNCKRTSVCVVRSVWQDASEALMKVFSATTIAGLAEKARQVQESRSLHFSI